MENNNIELTPKGYLKAIRIVHLALLAGMSIFGTIQFFLTDNWMLNWTDTDDIFFFIVPAFAIIGFVMSNITNKRKIESLKKETNLKEKLTGYQSASIIKYALIEAPALLGIIIFMLTANLYYLIISGILVLYFLTLKPSKEKVENELDLSREHKLQFSKSDEIIS